MAVTSIHPIKATINYTIDYIINPEKTDGKLLVTGSNCTPEVAAKQFELTRKFAKRKGKNLGWHLMQSFAPNEIHDPQVAHEIGMKLAKNILGDKYEFVIATHIDKDHIHNHIVFNAIDNEKYKHYESNKKSYYGIRNTSDRLCKNYGLSVIENPKKSFGKKDFNKTQAKKQEPQNKSINQEIIIDIQKAINESSSYEEFLENLKKYGYKIKQGKDLSLQKKGMERYRRLNTLSKNSGYNFSIEEIKNQIEAGYKYPIQSSGIEKKPVRKSKVRFPKTQALNLENSLKISYSLLPYEEKKQRLDSLVSTVNFLSTNKIQSISDINEKIEELMNEEKNTKRVLEILKDKTDRLSTGYALAEKYKSVKDRIDVLKNQPDSANNKELIAQEKVLAKLQQDIVHSGFKKLSEALAAQQDIKELKYARIELNNRYKDIRELREECSTVKENIEKIRNLKIETHDKHKQKLKKRESLL